jgi:dihydropteroate synthase
MRPRLIWRLRSRSLVLGERTQLMGIVNATPDSFSDGGEHFEPERAVEHALRLVEQGANLLDIGGESTRPGTPVGSGARVTVEEELKRVLPVIEGVLRAQPDTIISVDTYKSEVARQAVRAGAEIVNDVSAGRWDSAMLRTLAELECGAILMHTRGRPDEWRSLPPVQDVGDLVRRDLESFAVAAQRAGVVRERIVLDPGFGFGKNFDENYALLARLNELRRLEFPLLAGTSRKGFIGRALRNGSRDGQEGKDGKKDDRLYGTLATVTACILQGVHIVRVHDVAPAADAARVSDEIIKQYAYVDRRRRASDVRRRSSDSKPQAAKNNS